MPGHDFMHQTFIERLLCARCCTHVGNDGWRAFEQLTKVMKQATTTLWGRGVGMWGLWEPLRGAPLLVGSALTQAVMVKLVSGKKNGRY